MLSFNPAALLSQYGFTKGHLRSAATAMIALTSMELRQTDKKLEKLREETDLSFLQGDKFDRAHREYHTQHICTQVAASVALASDVGVRVASSSCFSMHQLASTLNNVATVALPVSIASCGRELFMQCSLSAMLHKFRADN